MYAGGQETRLNSTIIGETFWSIWKAIVQSLKEIGRGTPEECKAIALAIGEAQPFFLALWIQTVKNSKIGKANEGKVVLKWKEEAVAKEKLEKERRKKHFEETEEIWQPDAKYEAIVYKDFRSGGETVVDMKKMRSILEKKLEFVKRIPVRQ